MPDIRLLINGIKRSHHSSIRLRSSMVEASSSLELTYGAKVPVADLPKPGDRLRLYVGQEQLFWGNVDRTSTSYDGETVNTVVTARDLVADADDSSVHPGVAPLTAPTLKQVAETLVGEVDGLSLQCEDGSEVLGGWVFERGATVLSELFRAARSVGYIVRSDGASTVIVEKPAKQTSERLSFSIGGSLDLDHSQRFYECLVLADVEDSRASNLDLASKGQSLDPAIRQSRRLVVIGDRAMTPEIAQRRAEWEQSIRAAESEKLTASTNTWLAEIGSGVWKVNTLVSVSIPVLGIARQPFLLSELELFKSDTLESAQHTYVRRGAFLPEPEVPEESFGGLAG